MCTLSIQDLFVFAKGLYVYYCKDLTNSTNLHIPFSYWLFNTAYHALKEVGGADAQMLPWQQPSCLSLNCVRNICGFDSIVC